MFFIESEKLTKETSFFTSWTYPILKMSVYEDYEYFCNKTRDIFTPKNTSHFWRTIRNMKIKVRETRPKPTQSMQPGASSSHPGHLHVEFPPRKLCRKALETYLSGGKAASGAG
jgi:hypothetical protein